VSSNPRVVKEANALAGAGYGVHVIAGHWLPLTDYDQAVLSAATWTYTLIEYPSGLGRIAGGIARRLARQASHFGGDALPTVAAIAHNPLAGRLIKAARRVPADLYIAHYLAALPAATRAATRNHARLGFDAEDFHSGDLPDEPKNRLELRMRQTIERAFLSGCDYVTAASPFIAETYAARYGIRAESILNVFPLSQASCPSAKQAVDPKTGETSVYWFSQTISAGRGLETALEALKYTSPNVHLYLRGTPASGFAEVLLSLARRYGVEHRLHFLERASSDEMVQLASQHDIGLSTEPREPLNRDICLTNKLFTYLLAGVPQIMTRTRAQGAIANDLGDAAQVVEPNDPAGLGRAIDHWVSSPERLNQARTTATKLGRQRYNWDVEKEKLLAIVRRVT
jgi:glycosyltransferase involved in cell wall biosynthesis